jgi:hypothetical protein
MLAGFRRAYASPFLLLGLWLFNFVAAVPAAWIVAASLHREIGATRAHEGLRDGFDMVWYGEYADRATGLGKTFRPTVTGVGPFLDNLDGWITGKLFLHAPLVIGLAAAYGLVWILMLGGAVDRYVHGGEPAGPRRFIRAGKRFYFRFLRLALLSGALYAAVYVVSARVFEGLKDWTRDVTVEGTLFFYSLCIWGAAAFLVTLVHMAFGYAKIATVAENRRSMLLAALRGLAFVVEHRKRTLGQYYGVLLISAALLALFFVAAPGAGQSTPAGVLGAFCVGQLFLLARTYVRLSLLAGQTVLYSALTGAAAPQARGDAPGLVDPAPGSA